MKNFEEQPKIEENTNRGRIFNEDIPGWMETLREGGFSDEEIDRMLAGLNQEYAEQKLPKEIRESWGKIVKNVERNRGSKMSEKEKQKLFDAFSNVIASYKKSGGEK